MKKAFGRFCRLLAPALLSASYFGGMLQGHGVTAPEFSPTPGDAHVWYDVDITGSWTIRFTLDGNDPTLSSTLLPSSGKVRVLQSLTLKAGAWDNTNTASAVTSGDYRVTGAAEGGGSHSIWLKKSNGALYGVGTQTGGRLGNGVSSGNATCLQIVLKDSDGTAPLDVTTIAAGDEHSVVGDRQGKGWAFGVNDEGQVGQNHTTNLARARQVLKSTTAADYLTGVVEVAAGKDFSSLRAEHACGMAKEKKKSHCFALLPERFVIQLPPASCTRS